MKLVSKKIVKEVVLDASTFTYGRLCNKIANILLGKYNEYCAVNKLTGSVLIEKLNEVKFSGKNKPMQICHYKHTGYAGGLRKITLQDYINKDRLLDYVKISVYKMMPKTHTTRLYIHRNVKVKIN